MAPFKSGASIWDLLREKRVSWEIKGQGNARKSFAKKRVAFDAINMTCAGGRVPVDDWDELRKVSVRAPALQVNFFSFLQRYKGGNKES